MSNFILLPNSREMKTLFSVATENYYSKEEYRYSSLIRMEIGGYAERFLKILLENGKTLRAIKRQTKRIFDPEYYVGTKDHPEPKKTHIIKTLKFAKWVEQTTGERLATHVCVKVQSIIENALIQLIYLGVKLLPLSRRSTLYPKELQAVGYLRLMYLKSE